MVDYSRSRCRSTYEMLNVNRSLCQKWRGGCSKSVTKTESSTKHRQRRRKSSSTVGDSRSRVVD